MILHLEVMKKMHIGAIMNKKSLIAVIVIAIVIIAYLKIQPPPPPPPPTLISLQKMGHLVSLKVNVADVIEIDQTTTIEIPLTQWGIPVGATKVLFVMKGHGFLATQLDMLTPTSYVKDETNRTATLNLPKPILLSKSVDPVTDNKEGSRFYVLSQAGVDIFTPKPNASNAANNLALKKIEVACNTPEAKKSARENAERVLTGIFKELGWKLTINWI